MAEIVCATCGKGPLPPAARRPQPKKRYCSVECKNVNAVQMVDVTCAGCGVVWQMRHSIYAAKSLRSNRLYHNRDCFQKHKPVHKIVLTDPRAKFYRLY